jgi:flagellar biosynthesis/type III secretory pathway ATPase
MITLENIDALLKTLHSSSAVQEVGEVERVVGLMIESKGPNAKLGDSFCN